MSVRSSAGAVALALLSLTAIVSLTGAKADRARESRADARSDSAQVLVRIGRDAITRGDVQRRIDDMPEAMRSGAATPEGRQQVLDRLIEEKIWYLAALKNGVADRPRVRAQIEDSRRNLILRTFVQEVMANTPPPSDSQAKVYYDAHATEYRIQASVSVRHIQTRTQVDARKVIASLKAGGDFARLAKTWSQDTLTRGTGGMLGSINQDGMFSVLGRQPALAESVFTLKTGQIGGPWKTNRGWHVIKADEVTPESTRPFDQVRQMILHQLANDQQRSYYNSKVDSIRKALGVTPDSAAIRKFVSQKKTAREMFQDAQAKGPAPERIAAYQAVLQQYPDSEVAPQSQFMIGFIQSEELKSYDEAEKSFRALLARYPKSELAASAQWMVEHMRSEDAPPFKIQEADSSSRPPAAKAAARNSTGKP